MNADRIRRLQRRLTLSTAALALAALTGAGPALAGGMPVLTGKVLELYTPAAPLSAWEAWFNVSSQDAQGSITGTIQVKGSNVVSPVTGKITPFPLGGYKIEFTRGSSLLFQSKYEGAVREDDGHPFIAGSYYTPPTLMGGTKGPFPFCASEPPPAPTFPN
jgi:hypothetical protein